MRKILFCAIAAVGLIGCEDGPDQVYNPSPNGAGDRWNNGNSPGSVDIAKNGYNDTFGGTSKLEICSGEQKAKVWAKMVNEPIKPPRYLAGLDVAGGDLWPGLLFEDAEKVLCQSDALGTDGEGSLYASWGDSGEVQVGYNLSNHKLNIIYLSQGYKGTMEFKSHPCDAGWSDAEKQQKCPFSMDLPAGQSHTYKFAVGKQIEKDGQPFILHWPQAGGTQTQLDKDGTELFDAAMYTFAPELPTDNVNCRASGACRLLPDGVGGGGWGARNLGFYLHFPSIYKAQPVPSTPDYFYLFPVKTLPFSPAAMLPKLDAEGPTAHIAGLGDKNATCDMKLGMTWKQFTDNCVTVLNDPQKNQLSMNKLLGNLTHDDDNYILDVVGVNLDFDSEKILAKNEDIIHDDWTPDDVDIATEYVIDIRANGPLVNEAADPAACRANAVPSNTACSNRLTGTGTIYREYALEVQETLNQYLPPNLRHQLGDPACLLPDPLPPNFNVNSWRPAQGCTGFEGFVFPQNAALSDPANLQKLMVPTITPFGNIASSFGFTTVMRPGDPVAVFCADAGDPLSGYDTYCGANDTAGLTGSLWDASFKRVLQVMGNGQIFNLPPEVRDRKFYFKIWAHAYIKYLMNAASFPHDLRANGMASPEPDHLIFDDLGGENEKFEYIDRRFVTATDEPLRFQYEVLILAGNQRDSKFQRRFGRAEKAMYQVMQVDKTAHPGQQLADWRQESNVRITNLAGSPVLRDGWVGTTNFTSYQCATDTTPATVAECTDPAEGGNPFNGPPKDSVTGQYLKNDYGEPALTRYQGAFAEFETVFKIGTNYFKKTKELPFIRSAQVEIPNFADPYAANDPANTSTPLQTIADWIPKSPTNGFWIPINGQRSRFYAAESLNFGGATLSMSIDGQEQADGTFKIQAIQSSDYMGDLYLCKDPLSGDLLRIEMYESMENVIRWVQDHPGSYDACGLIIAYSSYNNYPLYISAQKAGIAALVSTGSGFGRIASVQMWDPTL
jgi:hypothetical protein